MLDHCPLKAVIPSPILLLLLAQESNEIILQAPRGGLIDQHT